MTDDKGHAMTTPFTREQAEILTAMGHVAMRYTRSVHELVEMLTSQVATLKALVFKHELASDEEFEAVRAEVDAAAAVERALSPELARLEDELNRLMHPDAPEGPAR
jgi:hypothetical protein